jgi:hypothetical protein
MAREPMTPAELLKLQERMWNIGRFVVTRRGPEVQAVRRDAVRATTEVDRLCLEVERLRVQMASTLYHEKAAWALVRQQAVAAEFWAARCAGLEVLMRHIELETGERYLRETPRC